MEENDPPPPSKNNFILNCTINGNWAGVFLKATDSNTIAGNLISGNWKDNLSKYIVDAWAWIEYFRGTQYGAKLNDILEDPATDIYTCAITVAK